MQDAASLDVVVLGRLVIIHLLTSKDEPAGQTPRKKQGRRTHLKKQVSEKQVSKFSKVMVAQSVHARRPNELDAFRPHS
jgi:hypothetical protein